MANQRVSFNDVLSFSRASTATYFDSSGVLQTAAIDEPRRNHDPVTGESLGVLLEPSRTNLLTDSGFATSAAPPAPVEAPGGTPAIAYTPPDETWTYYSGVSLPTASLPESSVLTLTAVVKPFGNTAEIRVYRRSSNGWKQGGVRFDVATGAVSPLDPQDDFTSVSVTKNELGGGWVELSAVLTYEGALTSLTNTSVYCSTSTSARQSDGVSGVYITRPQLEQGTYPTSYIPTAGAPVTRAADIITTRGDA